MYEGVLLKKCWSHLLPLTHIQCTAYSYVQQTIRSGGSFKYSLRIFCYVKGKY